MAVRLNPLPAGVFDQEILDFPSSRADIAGMANKALTIQKLRRLAAGTGNEAETARIVLAQLEKAHPGAAAEADASEEPEIERWFSAGGWHNQQLVVHLAYYLGCTPLRRRDRRSSGVLMRGPGSMVAAAPAIYKALSKRLAELHRGTTIGFLLGALPSDPPEDQEPSAKKPDKLSPEALAAARLALDIGRGAQPRKTLAA
jgi:hypothetical protein